MLVSSLGRIYSMATPPPPTRPAPPPPWDHPRPAIWHTILDLGLNTVHTLAVNLHAWAEDNDSAALYDDAYGQLCIMMQKTQVGLTLFYYNVIRSKLDPILHFLYACDWIRYDQERNPSGIHVAEDNYRAAWCEASALVKTLQEILGRMSRVVLSGDLPDSLENVLRFALAGLDHVTPLPHGVVYHHPQRGWSPRRDRDRARSRSRGRNSPARFRSRESDPGDGEN